MTDWTVLVVYCDGPGGRRRNGGHQRTPVAAYRRLDGDWLPIHSLVFDGEQYVLSATGFTRLLGNDPLPDGFVREVDGEPGAQFRTAIQWTCPVCSMRPSMDHNALSPVCDYYAAHGEVSLREIETKRRRRTKHR